MTESFELTMEELRRRIAAAGVAISEERMPMVRKLLSDALAPVRAWFDRHVPPEARGIPPALAA